MIQRLTGALFWEQRLTPAAERAWAVVLLLAPLALIAATWMEVGSLQRMPVRVEIDRPGAFRLAHEQASRLGIDTTGWQENLKVDGQIEDYLYLVAHGDRGRELLTQFGVWNSQRVSLRDPDGDVRVDVFLHPSGRVLGYSVEDYDPGPSQRYLSESEALALVRKAIEAKQSNAAGIEFAEGSILASGIRGWRYVSTVSWQGLADLKGELTIRIAGDRILADLIEWKVPKAEKEHIAGSTLHTVLKVVHGIYVALLFCYVLVRYLRRRVQKEVSQQRFYLVGLLAMLLFTGMVVFTGEMNVRSQSDIPLPDWLGWVFAGLLGLLFGSLVGVAYAGSEADLREPMPEKLVSLDALLCGRFLSRNVGRSVALGIAVFSWIVLVRSALQAASGWRAPGAEFLDGSYSYLFSPSPLLSLLLASPFQAIVLTVSGLACPLALLLRRVRRPNRIPYWLVPLAAIGTIPFIDRSLFFPWNLVMLLVYAGSMIAVFFAVDLLAVAVLTTSLMFHVYFTGMAQAAPVWALQDEYALLLAGMIVVAASWAAFRGRVVRPADVRPAYAGEIQERVQLEGEIVAARVAQQRLLPQSSPNLPGLSLAASCQAAKVVSGDFYDFFPIGGDRLGILVSDGGGSGLVTALAIALTKGYLMHKSQCSLSPLETLQGLAATLGVHLHGISADGLFYAVLDTREGVLRFARIGETPGVVAAGDDTVHEIRHTRSEFALWEGHVRISPGNPILIYTNGISQLIGQAGRSATDRWLSRRIGKLAASTVEELHASILKAVFKRGPGLGTRTPTDDVTLLVFSSDRRAATGVERVA